MFKLQICLLIHISAYCSLASGNINDLLETEILLQFIVDFPLLGGYINTKRFFVCIYLIKKKNINLSKASQYKLQVNNIFLCPLLEWW